MSRMSEICKILRALYTEVPLFFSSTLSKTILDINLTKIENNIG